MYSIELDKMLMFVTGIIHLILFIPMLASFTRRLRDTGLKEGLTISLIVIYVVAFFSNIQFTLELF